MFAWRASVEALSAAGEDEGRQAGQAAVVADDIVAFVTRPVAWIASSRDRVAVMADRTRHRTEPVVRQPERFLAKRAATGRRRAFQTVAKRAVCACAAAGHRILPDGTFADASQLNRRRRRTGTSNADGLLRFADVVPERRLSAVEERPVGDVARDNAETNRK